MGGVMGAIDKLRGRGKKSKQRKGDTGKQRKKHLLINQID